MKTFNIEFKPSASEAVDDLYKYVEQFVKKIGSDYGAVEGCDITIDRKDDIGEGCEVSAYLTVPRHKYLAKNKKSDFRQATKDVFIDLYKQLETSGWQRNK